MFDGGTKVIAIASSIKKKTGARKGTLAYIGWPHVFGSRVPSIAMAERWYIYATTFTVPIIRYGFEETLRYEVKSITSLFPYNSTIKKDNVKSMINNFVKKMDDDSYTNAILKHLRQSNPSSPTDCGLFVPVKNTENFNSMNDLEFTAWIDSILMNNEFQLALDEGANSLNKLDMPGGTLNFLMDCCYDKETKHKFFETMLEDLAYRTMMVRIIRQILTLKLKRNRRQGATFSNGELVNGDRQLKERNLVGYTIHKMFSNHFGDDSIILVKEAIKSFKDSGYISEKQEARGGEILNRVKLIKDCLYKLA